MIRIKERLTLSCFIKSKNWTVFIKLIAPLFIQNMIADGTVRDDKVVYSCADEVASWSRDGDEWPEDPWDDRSGFQNIPNCEHARANRFAILLWWEGVDVWTYEFVSRRDPRPWLHLLKWPYSNKKRREMMNALLLIMNLRKTAVSSDDERGMPGPSSGPRRSGRLLRAGTFHNITTSSTRMKEQTHKIKKINSNYWCLPATSV